VAARGSIDVPQSITKIARRTGRALFGVAGVSGNSGVGGFTDDLKASWTQAIIEFQQKRADLDTAESALYEVYPSLTDQEDLDEWQRVFAKVNAAKSGMDAVASLVQGAADVWNSVTGALGLAGVKRRGVAGVLGFAPLLPISLGTVAALTAGAVAAIAAVYGFVAYINAKTSRYQQLVDAGVDPVTASQEATRAGVAESGYSIGGRVEKIALIALAGVALFTLAPMLKKK
jgi:hypothetical protein